MHRLIFIVCFFCPTLTLASDHRFDLKLTAGASFQVKNDVQIPNNEFGTRFSLADAVGDGPVAAVRFEFNWHINQKHGLRILVAPLSYSEPAEFDESVNFAGGTFAANTPTTASYRFNSYRIGYHYTFINSTRTSFRVGATLKIRDAEIRLEQADAVSSDDDLGFVPLLYVSGERRFNNNWFLGADLDGLAGGPGRAIDVGITLGYAAGNVWRFGAELRVLEGGADVESVNNFAQFNSASLFINAQL